MLRSLHSPSGRIQESRTVQSPSVGRFQRPLTTPTQAFRVRHSLSFRLFLEGAMAWSSRRQGTQRFEFLASVPKTMVALMVFLVAFFMPLDATTTAGVLGAAPACAMQIADDPDEGSCRISDACTECVMALGMCSVTIGSCPSAVVWCKLCASKPIECDNMP